MNKNIDTNTRLNCLEQIRSVHANLGISTSPELIESRCYEKAKNLEGYISLSLSILNKSKQALQSQNSSKFLRPMTSIYPSVNRHTSSDPLNALQSLAVSAGHSVQMPVQRNDANFDGRNSSICNTEGTTKTLTSLNLQQPRPVSFPLPPSLVLPQSTLMAHGQSISKEMVDMVNKSDIMDKNIALMPAMLHSTTSVPFINPTANNISHQTAEEILCVSQEMKRLKDRYLGTLKSFIEVKKSSPEKEMKIWISIRNILDNPKMILKPLTMKNVIKIEQLLMKAEQQLLPRESNQSSSLIGQSSHSGQSCKPSNSDPRLYINVAPFETSVSSFNEGNLCSESTKVNALDKALGDVCNQLMNTDKQVMKRVQEGLLKCVDSSIHPYQRSVLSDRVLAKSMDAEGITKSKRSCLSSLTDEDKSFKKVNIIESTCEYLTTSVLDSEGLLRIDLDIEKWTQFEYLLEQEMDILRREFTIEVLENQLMSGQWCTYDSEWGDSGFYSLTFMGQDLPAVVPAIVVRIPEDYLYSRYVDWNINEEKYSLNCGGFLRGVKIRLQEELTRVHVHYHYNVVPLLYVASIYKQSIVTSKMEYQNLLDKEASFM